MYRVVSLRVPFWENKLFIMYINDICKVSQVFKYILCSDDTNLLCCDRDLNELVRVINGGLEQLHTCFFLIDCLLIYHKLTT